MDVELNPGPLQKKPIYLLTCLPKVSGLVSYPGNKPLSTNNADTHHVGICGSYYSEVFHRFSYRPCSPPLSSTYRRCRAGRRVRERKAWNIHRIASLVSYPRASRGSDNLHKGSISNNLYVITPGNTNNHVSSNVTSTNSSFHTNSLLNPRSILNFAVFNSRSSRNKIRSIIDHVVENDIGLCTVTENCLNDVDSVSIAQLSVADYSFINFPRQSHNRGGGTGILFRDSLKVSLVDGKENKSFEFLEWTVKVHDRSMRYVRVYRPPYSSLHPISTSVFFDEFSQCLENVVMCSVALVIFGDFNLHLDDLRVNDTKKFMDLLETFSLSQHVSGPIHLSGHTLDLIITRSSHIVLASPKITFPISDHFIIQCPIGFSRPVLSYKKLTFRKFKLILILLRSPLILLLLCFVQAYTGTTLMHSPTALTRPLLIYWISLPRLKQGLWLIVERSHCLIMTWNNSSVNVVALRRESRKLISLK